MPVTAPSDPAARGNAITRVTARLTAGLHAARARWSWLDHLVHAGGRYNRSQCDLLASGVTYYVFLALFPVVLLLASVAGFVLAGTPLLQLQLIEAIRSAVPGGTGDSLALEVTRAIDARGTTGVIGLAGFLFVGLGAMDKLRVGMDIVWRGEPDPPDVVGDRVKDLLALLGFAAAGVLSLALSTGTTAASAYVLGLLGVQGVPGFFLLTAALGIGLALAGDTLMFLWLLKGVPNTPYGVRRLLPGAVFGAVGFEVLKIVGGYYLTLLSGNVTVATFGSVVGVIIWINVVARFAFFTASWTATLPAVEYSDAPVSLGPEAPTPLPDVVMIDERGPRGSPLAVGLGLLGAGAVAGAASWHLVPRWLPRHLPGRSARRQSRDHDRRPALPEP